MEGLRSVRLLFIVVQVSNKPMDIVQSRLLRTSIQFIYCEYIIIWMSVSASVRYNVSSSLPVPA